MNKESKLYRILYILTTLGTLSAWAGIAVVACNLATRSYHP